MKQRISSPNFYDEDNRPIDFSWIWSSLIELGDTGCWIWQGKLSERGKPMCKQITFRVHAVDARRVVLFQMGKRNCFTGRVVPKCKSGDTCCNPAHFILVKN
jgi:hypothetical protein